MNAKERIILTYINKYNRIGLYELKEELNCSVSAVAEMIFELEEKGFISSSEDDYFLTNQGLMNVLNSLDLYEEKKEFDGQRRYNGVFNENGFPLIKNEGELQNILMLSHVNKLAYHEFFLHGKRKIRTIAAPSLKLKERQRWILRNILERIEIDSNVHGFVQGKSIVTNAKQHINKEEILCVDILEFFGSIKSEKVFEVFLKCGYDENISRLLTELCTYNDCLPQGAPTSPALSNIIFKNCDIRLKELAQANDLTYSRYADDITVSSNNNNIFQHYNAIKNILSDEGYRLNKDKTHIMVGKQRKIVTGLLVSDKVKVLGKYKRSFRQEIYYCKKFGIASHLRAIGKGDITGFKEYMYGKAYFICMVEKEYGQTLLRELDEIFLLE